MPRLEYLTINEAHELLQTKQISATELVNYYLDKKVIYNMNQDYKNVTDTVYLNNFNYRINDGINPFYKDMMYWIFTQICHQLEKNSDSLLLNIKNDKEIVHLKQNAFKLEYKFHLHFYLGKSHHHFLFYIYCSMR